LASRYDFCLDLLFKAVDDWNYKYIDQVNLKRFLIKCSVLPNEHLLVAIIRRIDLDADAKLNFKEFIDAIRPIENFTIKKVYKPSVIEITKARPKSSIVKRESRNKPRDLSAGYNRRTATHIDVSPMDQNRSILKKSATKEAMMMGS
jgi:hypothetical protein